MIPTFNDWIDALILWTLRSSSYRKNLTLECQIIKGVQKCLTIDKRGGDANNILDYFLSKKLSPLLHGTPEKGTIILRLTLVNDVYLKHNLVYSPYIRGGPSVWKLLCVRKLYVTYTFTYTFKRGCLLLPCFREKRFSTNDDGHICWNFSDYGLMFYS